MSAIPTDEPAQDAPPSMDAQQIQQQLQQQQDVQLNPQPVSTEPNRKRSSVLFIDVSGPDFCSNQRKHPRCGGLVLLVTLAKRDVVKYCRVRLVLLSACSLYHTGSIRMQSCLKRGLGTTCAYPDPDSQEHHGHQTPGIFYCAMQCPFSLFFFPQHPPTFNLHLRQCMQLFKRLICPINNIMTTMEHSLAHPPQRSVPISARAISRKKRRLPLLATSAVAIFTWVLVPRSELTRGFL